MILKMIAIFCASWFVLISCAFSQQRGIATEEGPSELTTAAAGAAEVANNNSCEGRQLETCIAIDRNPAVQTMKVYHNGRLAYTFPVSTGRETYDVPNNFERTPGCSFTPLGSFTISGLYENYLSNTWRTDRNGDGQYSADERAEMPFGMRLRNSKGEDTGIFLHSATSESALNALGPKESMAGLGSGGCVRMDTRDAQTLFDDLASCSVQSDVEYFSCAHREIDTPAGRKLACNRGTSQLPIACCESGNARRTCAQYAGGSPRCHDSTPACLAAQQASITPRQRQMVVEISDSRTDAQEAAAHAACERDRTNYENLFANCVARKLGSTSVTAFNALSETDKLRYRVNCNSEIYAITHPTTPAAGASSTTAAAAATTVDGRDTPAANIPATTTQRTPFFEGIRNWFRGLQGH